ncbi:uncharacterized protein EMH_0063260 [Eimeria mitis]|uniref:Peptidase A2 domain-containing protein n=1 Tax=Eimeria mitis TaxID=44415 RepID=U6KH41_9EIME|nr:uncharacterized protein EMH_0063260 [Eimeria mitis]CDJ36106.1 hypothetical protein, conserved [Eimeria mitis]
MGGHENAKGERPTRGSASKDGGEQKREERGTPADGEGDEGTTMIPGRLWWQEGNVAEHAPEYQGPLCSVGRTAVSQLEIVGHRCEGLLDTGAPRSFIRPTIVERLGLKARILPEAYSFTIANGEVTLIDREVPRLSMLCGGECFTGDFLVGPIPYSVILGIDWLVNHKVAWYFQSQAQAQDICKWAVVRSASIADTGHTGRLGTNQNGGGPRLRRTD